MASLPETTANFHLPASLEGNGVCLDNLYEACGSDLDMNNLHIPKHSSPFRNAPASYHSESRVVAEGIQSSQRSRMLAHFVPHAGTIYFNGLEGSLKFLEDLEDHFDLYNIPEDCKVQIAGTCLRDTAKTWYRQWRGSNPDSHYENFRAEFLEVFPFGLSRASLAQQLFSRQQGPNDSPVAFALETTRLYNLWDPHASHVDMLDTLVQQLDPFLQDFLEVRHPTTIHECLRLIRTYEERHGKHASTHHARAPREAYSENPQRHNRQNFQREHTHVPTQASYVPPHRRVANQQRVSEQATGYRHNAQYARPRSTQQHSERYHAQGNNNFSARAEGRRNENENLNRHAEFPTQGARNFPYRENFPDTRQGRGFRPHDNTTRIPLNFHRK